MLPCCVYWNFSNCLCVNYKKERLDLAQVVVSCTQDPTDHLTLYRCSKWNLEHLEKLFQDFLFVSLLSIMGTWMVIFSDL